MSLACILVSDVTGSTALFETLGSAEALRRIESVLARMRVLVNEAGGVCVKSKGDDVLSFFPHPDNAFEAAFAMTNEVWPDSISVHAGAYFGEILNHADDIYGNAVNTAFRLAGLAKPGEILFGDTSHDDLDPAHKARFLAIGAIPLRGKGTTTEVYCCGLATLGTQTTVVPGARATAGRTMVADVSFGRAHWELAAGRRVTIGRAKGCDILIHAPSVSRNHGALSVSNGQLEFTDHSSAGSIVRLDSGPDLHVHRRTTLLSGAGDIVIGSQENDAGNVLAYCTGGLERA